MILNISKRYPYQKKGWREDNLIFTVVQLPRLLLANCLEFLVNYNRAYMGIPINTPKLKYAHAREICR